jgi:hypothetical protein
MCVGDPQSFTNFENTREGDPYQAASYPVTVIREIVKDRIQSPWIGPEILNQGWRIKENAFNQE